MFVYRKTVLRLLRFTSNGGQLSAREEKDWMTYSTDVHLSELCEQFDVEDDSDHDDNISEYNQYAYDRNEVDVFDKIIHVIGNLISHCHTFLFSQ